MLSAGQFAFLYGSHPKRRFLSTLGGAKLWGNGIVIPSTGQVPADSFPMLAHETGKCNAIAKRLRAAFFGC